MVGSQKGFEDVRFAEPQVRRETGIRRLTSALGKIFGGSKGEPRRETQFEPIVFAPPVQAQPNRIEIGPEAEAFLASLPNGEIGANARKALEREAGRRGRALGREEAELALVGDENGGPGETVSRRDTLLMIMFGSRKEEFEASAVLMRRESVNVFYYNTGHFQKIRKVLRGKGEQEPVRAKGEDRERALGEIERILGAVQPEKRIRAFALVAEIVLKMGETLCSKEACERLEFVRMNVENAREGGYAALEEFASFARDCGFKPSGRVMASGVSRSEERAMRKWLEGKPEGVRKAAEALMQEKRPKDMQQFLAMLEADQGEGMEKRLFVGEEVLGRSTATEKEFGMLEDTVARNVAYYCIDDILKVTALADEIEDEMNREGMKKEALEIILKAAKRVPEGRRMEVPAAIANLARTLVERDGKKKLWVIGGWLIELGAYMLEPDKEIAYAKLINPKMMENPMGIV